MDHPNSKASSSNSNSKSPTAKGLLLKTFLAVLYYVVHVIFLGHPSAVLARLWLAYNLAHPDGDGKEPLDKAWKTFDDSMRESYRAIGTLAGLLAGAMSGLLSINNYREHVTIRTLLLAGVTASVISATSCLSMLSTVYFESVDIEYHWRSLGFIYVIALSIPSSWLDIALWIFQASILAIVWSKEAPSARVIATIFIGIRILFRVAAIWQNTIPVGRRPMLVEFLLGLLGWSQGMSHKMVNLNPDTVKRREEYLGKLRGGLARKVVLTGFQICAVALPTGPPHMATSSPEVDPALRVCDGL